MGEQVSVIEWLEAINSKKIAKRQAADAAYKRAQQEWRRSQYELLKKEFEK